MKTAFLLLWTCGTCHNMYNKHTLDIVNENRKSNSLVNQWIKILDYFDFIVYSDTNLKKIN